MARGPPDLLSRPVCSQADPTRERQPPGIEAIDRLAAARIEHEKVALEVAGEQHVARGRGTAAYIGDGVFTRQAIFPDRASIALIQPFHLSVGSFVPQPFASPV